MTRRQWTIILSALAVIGSSFLINKFLAAQKDELEPKAAKEVKKYVQTQPVKYGTQSTTIYARGRVRTAESLDLIAEKSGRMWQGAVALKEGQKFKKGTLLCKIDDTEAFLNLQSQKSGFLRELAAILPDFKIDFADNFDTWNSYFKSVNLDESLPPLPAYKSEKEKTFLATKNIFGSYYTIKSAEEALRKHRFYAPFDGIIAQVNMQSGSYVNPGAVIANIIRTDKLEIKVDVGTHDIAWIKKGNEVIINDETGQNKWIGKVVRIGEYVNPNTQSIDVYISVENGEKPLYDGLYLSVEIPGGNIPNAMEIPREAVFNGNEVYVLNDSLLQVQRIKIYKTNAETLVFNGLNEGDHLVVEPLINAFNGMRAYELDNGDRSDKGAKLSADKETIKE